MIALVWNMKGRGGVRRRNGGTDRRRRQSPYAELCATVSLRGPAISSLDWARDPEQVEGQRTVMNSAG